jgi:glycine cleavage system H protein
VKAVSEIYAPLSGEVTEINTSLADGPETVNTDPHGEGWLIKLKLSNPGEVSELLSAADYQAYVGDE